MNAVKNFSVKILLAISLLMVLTVCRTEAAEGPEKTTRVVALLPVENLFLLEDCGGVEVVNAQLSRAMHVPLNGVTKAVTFADRQEAQRELQSLVDSGRYVTKRNRPDYEAIMPVLADRLGADLVIFLRVCSAYETIYHSLWGERVIRAGVDLELMGYDRAEAAAAADEGAVPKKKRRLPAGVIRKEATMAISEEYTGRGLYQLTEEALDDLLRKTDLHQRVFPGKKR